MKLPLTILLITALPTLAHAATTTLYDASLNTLPEAQSLLFHGTGAPTETAPTPLTPYATLNTQPTITTQAGWATAAPSLLNATAGYTINFTVAVPSETRDPSVLNRAGFDLIVLSADPTKSLELALWPTKIFALEGGTPTPSFTAAESAPLDLTTLQNFHLSIQGTTYTLYNDTTLLLSGPLRNYTASTATVAGIPVYLTPGLLFLGDDTTEAAATTHLQSLSITNSPIPTPEPTSLAILALTSLPLLKKRRK